MENHYRFCEICRTCHWTNKNCLPIFYFKNEDYYGKEFQRIRANDFDDAAERFARFFNEDGGGYALMNNSLEVIISDGKLEKKYKVSAEPDIRYIAEEIK